MRRLIQFTPHGPRGISSRTGVLKHASHDQSAQRSFFLSASARVWGVLGRAAAWSPLLNVPAAIIDSLLVLLAGHAISLTAILRGFKTLNENCLHCGNNEIRAKRFRGFSEHALFEYGPETEPGKPIPSAREPVLGVFLQPETHPGF